MPKNLLTFLMIPVLLVVMVMVVVLLSFIRIWIFAFAAQARVTFLNMIGMRLRHVPVSLIVENLVKLKKAGLHKVTTDDLEAHLLAGGNVQNVVDWLVKQTTQISTIANHSYTGKWFDEEILKKYNCRRVE